MIIKLFEEYNTEISNQYKDGLKDGKWETYKNGSLIITSYFIEGKKNGPYIEYHDNGIISTEGSFIDDKRDGKWISYYINGSLKYDRNYKDDRLDGYFIEYYWNGNISRKGYSYYIDNKETEFVIKYSSNGEYHAYSSMNDDIMISNEKWFKLNPNEINIIERYFSFFMERVYLESTGYKYFYIVQSSGSTKIKDTLNSIVFIAKLEDDYFYINNLGNYIKCDQLSDVIKKLKSIIK